MTAETRSFKPAPSRPISVLVVHRYRILADALGKALGERPDFELAGVMAESVDLLDILARDRSKAAADVVVFDVQIARSPVRLIREIRSRCPDAKILPMSVRPDAGVVALIEAGACGYVPLEAGLEDLLATIRQVHHNLAPGSPEVVEAVLHRLKELSGGESARSPAPVGPGELTLREKRVLELLASGCSNRQLADRLGISVSTVKMHLRNLFGKLGVERRQEAVRVAAESGLVRPALASSSRQWPA
ncbi:MAG: response regulator transcription factor [Acidobacteriota bacterium]